jgi:pyridoxine 5-phosphate synthase
MIPRLGVNVDHVATVRQARRVAWPDPVTAAALAELGGADQITIHLREDRRHIQDRDLRVLRETVQTRLNLEMAATDDMVRMALDVKPDTVTLVPERREELTTEGGLDVLHNREHVARVVRTLRDADIRVSLFVGPDLEQIKASHRIEAHAVEVHTGRYAEARDEAPAQRELDRVLDALKLAHKLGLGAFAGHGLHYQNTAALAASGAVEEFNIGHSIVGRAVLVGMERAVREMVEVIRAAAQHGETH